MKRAHCGAYPESSPGGAVGGVGGGSGTGNNAPSPRSGAPQKNGGVYHLPPPHHPPPPPVHPMSHSHHSHRSAAAMAAAAAAAAGGSSASINIPPAVAATSVPTSHNSTSSGTCSKQVLRQQLKYHFANFSTWPVVVLNFIVSCNFMYLSRSKLLNVRMHQCQFCWLLPQHHASDQTWLCKFSLLSTFFC